MAERAKVNREYKDRLFKFVFQKREDLLSLYNAVNGTDYSDPDEIEVNTLENVIFMGMKNDISFLITDCLNLYEHQSTFNPNMPLRGFFYFADLYRKILGNKADIFSSSLIRIPTPKYVVFYNGTKDEPDRAELLLSDSFIEKGQAALECRAVMLNINAGHNKEMMNKCRRLNDYAVFIGRVRQYLKDGILLGNAIDLAMDECIGEGILEDILSEFREEVHSMLLYEYDEELHIKNEKELSFEEGLSQGISQGIIQGISQGKKEVVLRMKTNGLSVDEIVRITGYDRKMVADAET